MATVAGRLFHPEPRPDVLSGTPRAHAIDRWIFVFMAAWFIFIVLVGFIPDAIGKVQEVQAGQRPPFPLVMHMHAVAMGSFLLLLLAQTVMVATGREALHKKVGIAAFVLVPVLVLVGIVLAPTMYYQTWSALQTAPPGARAELQQVLSIKENILLLQVHAGILFAIFITVALRARVVNSGMHKRMMFLATSVPLAASIDRMTWLPSSLPVNPWTTDLYILLALAPMFVWDVIRNRKVHEAYGIWLAIYVPVALLVDVLWDKPWWHATARSIMRV
jgi:uncharacterized membrane protein